MTIRNYSSRAQQTTLSGSLSAGAGSTTVVSGSNLMGGVTPATSTYTVVIDPDTTLEEIVDITAVSGNILTITRGIDGSSDVAHSAGAIVRHMVTGRDLREANNHSENVTTAHGLTIANVVSTTNSGTVTSTMIANDTIVDGDINTAAAIAWTKLAPSSTVSAAEVARLAGVTSAIQTQIDAKLATATAASTYAPLASPALTGVPVAPTAAAATNTTQLATTAYVRGEITNLIGGAPATLDTLTELAAAIANDAAYATTITTALATKLPKAGGTMTGAIDMGTTNKITSLATPTASTDAATKGYADSIVASAPGNLTGPITSVGAATSIASQTGTGTKFVVDTSPTLVTPVLGVATATSINGSSIPTSKTLVVTTDKLSALAGTTSAELAGVISDETGSGPLVFATLPTFGGTGVKLAGSTSGTTTVVSGAVAGSSVITLPVASGTVALTSDLVTPPFVGAIAYDDTSRALTSGVGTALVLASEVIDTNSFHDNVTNNSRMTIPSGKDGKYLLNVAASIWSGSTYTQLYFYKNGVAITQGIDAGQIYSSGTAFRRITASAVVTAVAGDYFQVLAGSDGASPTQEHARFSITYLGA